MSWGDAFSNAYDAASDAAKAAAAVAMSSARAAADAVGRAGEAAKDGIVEMARGTARVAGFGARAVGEVASKSASAAGSAVTAPYRAAKQLFAPADTPVNTAVCPCPDTWAGKKARLEKRRQLIKDGSGSPDPKVTAAAARLAANSDAVELARLSEDSYKQYDPKNPKSTPPPGWHALTVEELEAQGISQNLLKKSRAVIYETPADWPGGKKTVLAFRGTADLEDGIVDHDQAMGLDTEQYQSSIALGRQVSRSLGTDVQVTGHSLGGGKAQAAGIAGGLSGTMFNAAGPNPDSTGGLAAAPGQFTQFRTNGDPLTGVQNSPALQSAIVGVVGPLGMIGGGLAKVGGAVARGLGFNGLSPAAADYADKAFKALPRSARNVFESGNALPPAQGAIREVPAINDQGQTVSGANLLGQHSITSAVNGIERQKTEDMATLAAM